MMRNLSPSSPTLQPDDGGDGDAEALEERRASRQGVCSGGGSFDHLDGYTVNFTSFREDIDGDPFMERLPDDR
jgi:hypothetical protein